VSILRYSLILVAIALCAPAQGASAPFWGAKASVPTDTPISHLREGEFLWKADASSAGRLVMVVSLTEQRAYVYRDGALIGATTVSTGGPGHETPTGVFTILQKEREHRSTIYDGEPMPYMQRLTWDGVALHAGGLPGYPASHGCVHLPSEFARLLYGISGSGTTVVISSEATQPEAVSHPGYLIAVDVAAEKPVEDTHAAEAAARQPDASADSPVSIVLSRASRRIVVYRDGIEIDRAPVQISGDEPFPTRALVLTRSARLKRDSAAFRWLKVAVPGSMGIARAAIEPDARIRIPSDFVTRLNSRLTVGATLLVTDEPITSRSVASRLQVADAALPADTVVLPFESAGKSPGPGPPPAPTH
jgi:hypothetical protein